jgi:hypothetical protein
MDKRLNLSGQRFGNLKAIEPAPVKSRRSALLCRCFPMRTGGSCRTVDRETSRFPRKERLHMPGSLTTPGRLGARVNAP